MDDLTASAVFRQLRAAPADAAAHAAQLALVRRLVAGKLELHLPRKARSRALLEWAAGRCAVKEGPNTPSCILDAEYWSLFSQILVLKDDSSPFAANSSTFASEEPNLLSKSDIRQTVLLSRGISLLQALTACLETVPSLLLDKSAGVAGTSSSSVADTTGTQRLLESVHSVFEVLFPLSLSSPTTTLDGLLPCIHAFIRSSGTLASSAQSVNDVLPAWNKLGQLLLHTLSSLVKTPSNVQTASANDKLLLRKVAGSFLDQVGGYANWRAYTGSYTSILQASSALINFSSEGKKGKGKARDVAFEDNGDSLDAVIACLTSSSSSSVVGLTSDTSEAQDSLQALQTLLNGFITTSIFAQANLARYFSTSSGSTLDTPKQAREALSELLNTLKETIRSSKSPDTFDMSKSTVSIMPRLVADYIETLSSHAHDLFAPSRRNRAPGEALSTGAASSDNGSRSAVEYQVQTCFRNAVFGMLQGVTQLLREALSIASPSSTDKNTSPRKRQRYQSIFGNDANAKWAIAESLKLVLSQIQEKNIYISGGGELNREWLRLLKDAARLATEELLPTSENQDENDANASVAVMQAVTSIAKMDYTALEDVLPSILRAMGTALPRKRELFSSACNELLDAAVSNNGKTRQLDSIINGIQAAVSSIIDSTASTSEDPFSCVERMDSVFKAPLLSRHTSARISKECKTSLPITQFVSLFKTLLEKIQTQLVELKEGHVEAALQPPKKKSKSGRASLGNSAASSTQQEKAAWTIYAMVHIVQSILSGNTATNMFQSNLEEIEGLEALVSTLTSQAVDFDAILTANSATQRVGVSVLQLQSAWSTFREKENKIQATTADLLIKVLQTSNSVLPVLKFEIIRTLLSQAASAGIDSSTSSQLIGSMIAILESPNCGSERLWDGHSHNLSSEDLPIAIWWLVSTKYMDIFEQAATEQQLASLVDFIFLHSANQSSQGGLISVPAITDRLLHSADFFELLRWRESFSTSVRKLCDSANLQRNHLDILLLLPKEYLDRSFKRKIVASLAAQKDALAGEKTLLALLKFSKDDPGQPLIKDTAFLQTLAFEHTGSMSPLITGLYEQLWRLMVQNWSASPDSYKALPAFLEKLSNSASPNSRSLYLLTWRVLASETKIASIPAGVLSQLESQATLLKQSVISHATTMVQLTSQLEACTTAQLVSEWMTSTTATSGNGEYAELAKKAISMMLHQDIQQADEQLAGTTYLALQLASMNISSTSMVFEAFVVSFWLLAQKYDLTEPRFSTLLAKTCTSQPEDSYKAAVSTISQAVSPDLTDDAFAAALQVLAILVCNSPDIATRIASQTFSQSLRQISLFNNAHSLGAASPAVLHAITSYIKTFLEQRIGVPELQDVAVIWTILHDILTPNAGASVTSATSGSIATSIFLNSVDIVSLLATHRRDHVIPTFAQFSRILSDILQLLRVSGVSATTSMTACRAAFPSWAVVGHGRWMQNVKCSKTAARLLLSLGTRTTILQRSSVRSRGGASSSAVMALTGPLSKHAPFIMVNYLTAATDSRFPLTPSVRKEINAGILEILSSMGKSEREALMKAYLQADQEAERVLLRVMWKEFDAVRYKGD